MDEIHFDVAETERRFRALKRYCEQEAKIAPGPEFACVNDRRCHRVRPNRVKGGLAHVGSQCVMSFGEKPFTIMFIGYDYGRGAWSLETCRQQTEEYPQRLNPHYKGIVKVMMEIFQVKCEQESSTELWTPLLKRMSQTNGTRCCAPVDNHMACNTTQGMRRQCWPHLKKEIEILRPTIILFHGAQLRQSFLKSLHSDGCIEQPIFSEFQNHCCRVRWPFPDPFDSVLLFFSHPSHPQANNSFGSQWDTTVVPILNRLRQQRWIPTVNPDWRPRLRKQWPSI